MLVMKEMQKVMKILNSSHSSSEGYVNLMSFFKDIDSPEIRKAVLKLSNSYFTESRKNTRIELVEDRLTGTLYEMEVEEESEEEDGEK